MSDDVDFTIEQLAAELADDWSDDSLADRESAPDLMNGQIVVNWRTIEGEERAEAAATLVEWVQEWLIPRYSIQARAIPDCWYRHGDLVEELSALHSAWLVSFDAADGGYGPIGWHERFSLALTRSAFRAKCVDGHQETRARVMTAVTEAF